MLIAGRLIDVDDLPERFQDPSWENPSLKRDQLRAFLDGGFANEGNYLVKNHFAVAGERNAMLFHPSCKVIMTFRDMRDSIVSRYFHHLRVGEVPADGSFLDFFWAHEPPNGRQTLEYMSRYVSTWSIEDETLWKVRYEDLHRDVEQTVLSLAAFLEVKATAVDLPRIIQLSQPSARAKPADGRHIRTGRPGTWKNHLGELELELVAAMVPERIRHLVLRDE